MLPSLAKTSLKLLALGGLGLLLGCAAAGERAKPIAAGQAGSPSAVVQTDNPAPKMNQLTDKVSRPDVSTASYQSPSSGSDSDHTQPADIHNQPLPHGIDSASKPHTEAIPIPPSTPGSDEPATLPSYPSSDPSDPFSGQSELAAGQLIGEVQARNPSLVAMIAAWRAAAEKYPQMIALDDPMFGYMLGTKGLGPDGGWMLMGSQKIPWFGKRRLRGEIAQSEANAACQDVADLRLRLAEGAADALYDYSLARREIEINSANTELMKEFRSIAMVRYESNQVTQQDVLQADLELADLEARRAELAREESVAVARINTLLHRAADYPLPPPARMSPPGDLPPVEVLRDTALHRRPDLAAEAARIQAEEANVELARKEFYPDMEIVGKYDAFMPEDMRPQLGMNVNVPLWQQKRSAAWREAMAKLQKERAMYADLADRTRFEVQSVYAELVEGDHVLHLYDEKILPVAKQYTQSARANYTAGKIDFLRLIDAQRRLYSQWEKYYQALADYHRRLAEMERVVGGYTF